MADSNSVKDIFDLINKDTSKILGLSFNGKTIALGAYVARADAQCAPSLSLAGPNMSPLARYIAIGLDLDAPFPTLALLSPILHWVQADYQLVPSLPNRMATNAGLLESSSPFVADYVGPAPPPGSYPHRYMFLLYEQPENCNIQEQAPPGGKPLGNWMRMRFDLHKWEIKNGLGNPVAMNYFLSN